MLILSSAIGRINRPSEVEGDNKQCVNNSNGESKSEDMRVIKIRSRIHRIFQDMKNKRTWIPREKNEVSDVFSKKAHRLENKTIHPDDENVLMFAMMDIFGIDK